MGSPFEGEFAWLFILLICVSVLALAYGAIMTWKYMKVSRQTYGGTKRSNIDNTISHMGGKLINPFAR